MRPHRRAGGPFPPNPLLSMTRSRTLLAVFAGALAFAGCDAATDSATAPSADARATGSYIVVFKDGTGPARALAQRLAQGQGVTPTHVYENTIRGFAAQLSPQAAEALARNPNVAYVEADQTLTLAKPGAGGGGGGAQTTPPGIVRVNGGVSGVGLRACVIDSGVDLDHPDLRVNTGLSRTFVSSGRDAQSADDGNGHGTHVAGTIAAVSNGIGVVGVAAGAEIVAVKVLNTQGSGAYSDVIAGVDYVGSGAAGCSVANMSLGGPVSDALDAAVVAASQNVRFALAAGNESDNAANHSPARANGPNIYTVSAVDSGDRFASFSNFGNPPVEVAAPGVSILSTWKGGGYNTISGTSMASPHVAGILLLGAVRTDLRRATGDSDGNADYIAIH